MQGLPDALRQFLSTLGREDQFFVSLALQTQSVDVAALQVAVHDYMRLRQAGHQATMAQILVRRRVISPEQFQSLWNEARRLSGPGHQSDPNASGAGAHQSTLRRGGARPERLSAGTFGPYTIVRELARGGMGVVYEATSPEGERVALKVIIAQNPSQKALSRFKREAEITSRLDHPNIVRILDCGIVENQNYLSMEFVEGTSLDKYLEEKKPDFETKLRLFRGILEGLSHAHTEGVVHRDMKPENVLVTSEGVPRITDFGLAKTAGGEQLTRTGEVMGTPYYMSPEQAGGMTKHVDHRADIFSVGTMMYEAFTGKLPFQGKSAVQLYGEILKRTADPPTSLNPELPGGIDRIIERAHQKVPEFRYPSARDMARDIEALLEGRSVRTGQPSSIEKMSHSLRENRRFYLVVAATVVLLGVGSFFTVRFLRERWREQKKQAIAASIEGARSRMQRARDKAAERNRERKFAEALDIVSEGLSARRDLEDAVPADAPDRAELVALAEKAAPARLAAELEVEGARARAGLGDTRGAALAFERALEALPEQATHLRIEMLDQCLRGQDFAHGLEHIARWKLDEKKAPLDLFLLEGALLEGALRHAEALASYERLLKSAGDEARPLLLCRRARARMQMGDLAKAEEDADEARSLDRERLSIEPFLVRAEIKARQNNLLHARLDLDKAIRKAPEDPRPLLLRGKIHLGAGHVEAARTDLEAAAAIPGCVPEVYAIRALASVLCGKDPEGVEQDLRRFETAIGPRNPVAWVVRGDISNLLGNAETAMQQYEKALSLREDLQGPTLARARLLFEKEPTRADAFLASIAALPDANPALLVFRARLLRVLGRHKESLAALDEAQKRDPPNAEARALRGLAYRSLKDRRADAESQRARDMEEEPGTPYGTLLWLGRKHIAGARAGISGDLEKGMRALERALRMMPTAFWARVEMARAHVQQRDWDKAEARFTEALEIGPGLRAPTLERAAARLQAGRTAEAAAEFKILLERDAGDDAATAGLARALLAQESYLEALALLDKALSRKPDHHELLDLARQAAEMAAPERVGDLARRHEETSPATRRKAAEELGKKGYYEREGGGDYRSLFKQALELAPGDPHVLETYARTLANDMDVLGAALVYSEYFTHECTFLPNVVMGFVRIERFRPFDDIVKGLDEHVAKQPGSSYARIARGWFLYWGIRDEKTSKTKLELDAVTGLLDLDQAIREHPDAAILYLFRAGMWLRLDYKEPYKADVERALLLQRDSVGVSYTAAELAAMAGEFERAVELLLKAKEQGLEDLPAYLRTLKVFEPIRDHPRLVSG